MTATDSPTARKAPVGIIILALAMGGFAIGTAEFSAMTLLPYYAAHFSLNEAQASYAISAYALGVVVGAPLLAMFGARFSKRKLLIALMAFYAVFNIAAALASSYGMMILFRFLAGFPHGAYFGVAMLLAASLVGPDKRSFSTSLIMTGLTAATLLGVPLANFLGSTIGWRWGVALAGAVALLSALLIWRLAPKDPGDPNVNPMRELSALKNRKVLIALLTGAIGAGGFFATYAFATKTLIEVTGMSDTQVPWVLMLMGFTMLIGTLITGKFADRNLVGTGWVILIAAFGLQLAYPWATGEVWSMLLVLGLIGAFSSFITVLQIWLMDVAGEAQTFAAAMNHASFNFANALGPLLAGMAVAAGWGLPSTGYVGAGLWGAGLLLYAWMIWDAKRA